MKKIYLVLSLILLAYQPAVANIPNSELAKSIVVVDIDQVYKDSIAAKGIRDQVEKKKNEFKSEINKREEELHKMNQDLSKQQSVLSEQAFEEKMRNFNNKVADVQRDVQNKRDILDQGFMVAVEDIRKVINEIIEQLTKEKGFSLALDSAIVLYKDNSLDITKEVTTRLNDRLKKLDLKLPAAPAAKAKK